MAEADQMGTREVGTGAALRQLAVGAVLAGIAYYFWIGIEGAYAVTWVVPIPYWGELWTGLALLFAAGALWVVGRLSFRLSRQYLDNL